MMGKPRNFAWIVGIFYLLLLATVATAGVWTSNKFFYQPSLGASGSTEKNNFDSGLNRVDTHLGKYKTLGDPDYETLAVALTTIGVRNPVTLNVPAGTWAITANTSIPDTVTLRFQKGGLFNVATDKTLTIYGSIDAGPYQIFSLTGTGMVSGLKLVDPCWFGAAGDNSTDNSAAFNAATLAVHNSGNGLVLLSPGNYVVSSNPVQIYSDTIIDGGSLGLVTIKLTATSLLNDDTGWFRNYDGTSGNSNIIIKNLAFLRTYNEAGGGKFDPHIFMRKSNSVFIENCKFENTNIQAYSDAKQLSVKGTSNITLKNCHFLNGPDCLVSFNDDNNSCTNASAMDCVFEKTDANALSNVLSTMQNVSLINNRFEGCMTELADSYWSGATLTEGMFVRGNKFNNCGLNVRGLHNVQVTDNDFYGTGGIYIYNSGDYPATKNKSWNVLIANNVVHGTGKIHSSCDDTLIIGNRSLGTAVNPSYGISVFEVDRAKIIGNMISYTKYSAISSTRSNDVSIINNDIYFPVNDTGLGWGYAIEVESNKIINVSGNKIKDTSISGYFAAALGLFNCQGITIVDNLCLAYKPGVIFWDTKTPYPVGIITEKRGNVFNFVPQEPTFFYGGSSAPSTDTWHIRSTVQRSPIESEEPMGWYCTAGGSFISTSVAGEATNGSNVITFADGPACTYDDSIRPGCFINVSDGFSTTGPFMILDWTTGSGKVTSVTINSLATSTTSCTVTNSAPTFVTLPSCP